MIDIIPFPEVCKRAAKQMELEELKIAAENFRGKFEAYVIYTNPRRDDAEFELECVTAVLRQFIVLNTKQ